MLELDRTLGSSRQLRDQSLAVVGLSVGLAPQLGVEHGEVIRHDQPDLVLRPVGRRVVVFGGLVLAGDLEPEPLEHEVRLPRVLPAAELLGHEDAAQEVPARQADHGLRGVPLALVDEHVAGGLTERITGTGVEVGARLEDVRAGQTCRDRLGHVAGPGGQSPEEVTMARSQHMTAYGSIRSQACLDPFYDQPHSLPSRRSRSETLGRWPAWTASPRLTRASRDAPCGRS